MILETTIFTQMGEGGHKNGSHHLEFINLMAPFPLLLLSSLPDCPPQLQIFHFLLHKVIFFSYDAFGLANTGSHTFSCVDPRRFSWCFSKRRQFLFLRGVLALPVRNKLSPPFRFIHNVEQKIKLCE